MTAKRIDPDTLPGETLIAAFSDVSGHFAAGKFDHERFVYVGRWNRAGLQASQWYNPFKVAVGTREEAIARYKGYLWWNVLKDNPANIEKLLKLEGKILVCWCCTDTRLKADTVHHEACHAELLRAAIGYYRKVQS